MEMQAAYIRFPRSEGVGLWQGSCGAVHPKRRKAMAHINKAKAGKELKLKIEASCRYPEVKFTDYKGHVRQVRPTKTKAKAAIRKPNSKQNEKLSYGPVRISGSASPVSQKIGGTARHNPKRKLGGDLWKTLKSITARIPNQTQKWRK